MNPLLLISIEKRRIDNIIIIGNELLFSYIDKETDEAIYSDVPVNEYEENSDYYHLVQSYLYDEEYLDFNTEQALESFKDECLKQHSKGNDSFKFKGLSILLNEIEDIPITKKIN